MECRVPSRRYRRAERSVVILRGPTRSPHTFHTSTMRRTFQRKMQREDHRREELPRFAKDFGRHRHVEAGSDSRAALALKRKRAAVLDLTTSPHDRLQRYRRCADYGLPHQCARCRCRSPWPTPTCLKLRSTPFQIRLFPSCSSPDVGRSKCETPPRTGAYSSSFCHAGLSGPAPIQQLDCGARIPVVVPGEPDARQSRQ